MFPKIKTMNSDASNKGLQIIQETGLMPSLDLLYPRITERRATLNVTGVGTKAYLYWRSKGLVGEYTEVEKGVKREWVRLNLYDFVWVKMLQSMRTFGMSVETMKHIKLYLEADMVKILSGQPIAGMEGEIVVATEHLSEEKKEVVKNVSAYLTEVSSSLEPEEKHLTTLMGALISLVVLMNKKVSILITQTEESMMCSLAIPELLENTTEHLLEQLSAPHFNIPLNGYVEEFMGNPKNENNLFEWGFINPKEMKVLEALRNNDYKEILIKKVGVEKEIIIEAKLSKEINGAKARELRKILGLKEYEQVALKYRNDNTLYVENRKRI